MFTLCFGVLKNNLRQKKKREDKIVLLVIYNFVYFVQNKFKKYIFLDVLQNYTSNNDVEIYK